MKAVDIRRRLVACLLAVASAAPALPAPNEQPAVGAWQSLRSGERLVFAANGFVRSCFAEPRSGNAAIGSWTEIGPGRLRIEFTHAVSPACGGEARLLRQYEVAISGSATVSRTQLALFVSGEGPPERFERVADR